MTGLIAAVTVAGALAIGGTYVLAPTIAEDSADTTAGPVRAAALAGLDPSTGPAPWADGKASWHADDRWQRPHHPSPHAQVAGVARFATMGRWADCVERQWDQRLHAEKLDLERACGPRPTPERRRS
jgi:hypothetical protein